MQHPFSLPTTETATYVVGAREHAHLLSDLDDWMTPWGDVEGPRLLCSGVALSCAAPGTSRSSGREPLGRGVDEASGVFGFCLHLVLRRPAACDSRQPWRMPQVVFLIVARAAVAHRMPGKGRRAKERLPSRVEIRLACSVNCKLECNPTTGRRPLTQYRAKLDGNLARRAGLLLVQ